MNPKNVVEYFMEEELWSKLNQEERIYKTDVGLFGTSDIYILWKFFENLNLSPSDIFIDLGSGDGRVTLLAGCYCASIGIEYDKKLIEISKHHKEKLGADVKFIRGNFEELDVSRATVLFSFSDRFWTNVMVRKLQREFKGVLYVYQGVYLPEGIKKGPTLWVDQIPIIMYDFTR